MNRYLAANIIVFLILTSVSVWCIWSQMSGSMVWKVGASFLAIVGCAFIEERFISRFINVLVGPRKSRDISVQCEK
jgi:hypothetical protein